MALFYHILCLRGTILKENVISLVRGLQSRCPIWTMPFSTKRVIQASNLGRADILWAWLCWAPTRHQFNRITLAVRKDARKAKIRLPELKARLVPAWLVGEGLRHALHYEWQAFAAIVDKTTPGRLPKDLEDLYRGMTAHVVRGCLQQSSVLHLIVIANV